MDKKKKTAKGYSIFVLLSQHIGFLRYRVTFSFVSRLCSAVLKLFCHMCDAHLFESRAKCLDVSVTTRTV